VKFGRWQIQVSNAKDLLISQLTTPLTRRFAQFFVKNPGKAARVVEAGDSGDF
jgi:hypothetical protein